MIFPQNTQVHLWHTSLDEQLYQSTSIQLLDAEEVSRAKRFKFDLHRKRFITAHAGLRSILSLYLGIRAKDIHILHTTKGKPYLLETDLQFNLSHSQELAVYAFTLKNAIGVDIEKIRNSYNDNIAKRFFSSEEYAEFSKLPHEQKLVEFYRIWVAKEALIKALGKGLWFPLSSFSIPDQAKTREIFLEIKGSYQTWYLENIDAFAGYQAAVVTEKKITELSYFEWTA